MPNDNPISVSVLTPTWNRCSYLHTVYEGLKRQTYRNFEWIVANDGSEDDTIEVVRKLSESSDFPVRLISASLRVGKSRMDNEAVRLASGDFILWCDSDDWLLPNALEVLVTTWMSIPEAERGSFAGVTALCDSKSGVLDNIFPNAPHTDVKLNDLLCKMQHDLVIFSRADLLKATPFLEVDYLIPETSVWNVIGVNKTRFIPVALKYINYRSDNCVSHSGLMEFNRGRAYALASSRVYLTQRSLGSKALAWRFINYLRYCIHGEIRIPEAVRMWGGGAKTIVATFLALTIASLLATKDYAQGKVRKTHREFLKSSRTATITIENLNA